MAILQANVDAVVTVDGQPLGGFQTITGGEVSAESVKDRPPGAVYEDAVEAVPTVGNITVSRSWDEARDGAILSFLNARAGWGVSNVSRIRRDRNKKQVGSTTYSALLVRVTPTEGNTNGGGDKGMLELEFNVTGGPA